MGRRNSHPKYSQFRFDAGSLALNFVATVRHRGSQPRDLLDKPEALSNWFQAAEINPESFPVSKKDYEEALGLREAITRIMQDILADGRSDRRDVERVNQAARFSIATPQLTTDSRLVEWEIVNPVKACLAVIARDAILVAGDTERRRLKMCNDAGCRMIFLDLSPGNRRRWCSMSICGNRQKVSAHRANNRELRNL